MQKKLELKQLPKSLLGPVNINLTSEVISTEIPSCGILFQIWEILERQSFNFTIQGTSVMSMVFALRATEGEILELLPSLPFPPMFLQRATIRRFKLF